MKDCKLTTAALACHAQSFAGELGMKTRINLFLLILLLISISCKNPNKQKIINKGESYDSLLEEAKFWVYLLNSKSDIFCFQYSKKQKLDDISLSLKSILLNDSTIEYKFNFFISNPFHYCNMQPNGVCGIGFFNRDHSHKYPIYSDMQFGIRNDAYEMNEVFKLADSMFRKSIKEKPKEVLNNKEFRRIAINKGYIR